LAGGREVGARLHAGDDLRRIDVDPVAMDLPLEVDVERHAPHLERFQFVGAEIAGRIGDDGQHGFSFVPAGRGRCALGLREINGVRLAEAMTVAEGGGGP